MNDGYSWIGGTAPVGVLDAEEGAMVGVIAQPTSIIRRALPGDVPALLELFDCYARLGLILPRTPEHVYRHLREYLVAVEDGRVVATAGLRIYNESLAEVVGVAVAGGWQGRGYGRRVVGAAVEEARELGIRRVFALTLQESFFKQLGFRAVPRAEVPEKIEADRIEGIDRTHCMKSTMVMDISPLDHHETGEN